MDCYCIHDQWANTIEWQSYAVWHPSLSICNSSSIYIQRPSLSPVRHPSDTACICPQSSLNQATHRAPHWGTWRSDCIQLDRQSARHSWMPTIDSTDWRKAALVGTRCKQRNRCLRCRSTACWVNPKNWVLHRESNIQFHCHCEAFVRRFPCWFPGGWQLQLLPLVCRAVAASEGIPASTERQGAAKRERTKGALSIEYIKIIRAFSC